MSANEAIFTARTCASNHKLFTKACGAQLFSRSLRKEGSARFDCKGAREV